MNSVAGSRSSSESQSFSATLAYRSLCCVPDSFVQGTGLGFIRRGTCYEGHEKEGRPGSPSVTVSWHASEYEVEKCLHQASC